MKPIILCADDYGVTESVGTGIRRLVEARRLSAVSCLSGVAAWPAEAALLKPLRPDIDVGLHFNLTLGVDHAAGSLNAWIGNSLSGRINQELVAQEFLQQLERFESVWGEPPDFVDGHQHVHIFPGIRDGVLRLLAERYPAAQRPWVRQVNPSLTGHDAPIKALVLKILSTGFARAARRAGLAFPAGFAGLYSLSTQANFPALLVGWLRRARPGTLLMCHPSFSAAEDPDGIGPARLREFQYLRSNEFADILRREEISLVRFCRRQ